MKEILVWAKMKSQHLPKTDRSDRSLLTPCGAAILKWLLPAVKVAMNCWKTGIGFALSMCFQKQQKCVSSTLHRYIDTSILKSNFFKEFFLFFSFIFTYSWLYFLPNWLTFFSARVTKESSRWSKYNSTLLTPKCRKHLEASYSSKHLALNAKNVLVLICPLSINGNAFWRFMSSRRTQLCLSLSLWQRFAIYVIFTCSI